MTTGRSSIDPRTISIGQPYRPRGTSFQLVGQVLRVSDCISASWLWVLPPSIPTSSAGRRMAPLLVNVCWLGANSKIQRTRDTDTCSKAADCQHSFGPDRQLAQRAFAYLEHAGGGQLLEQFQSVRGLIVGQLSPDQIAQPLQ